jgi:hypothetical protein
MAEIEVRLAVDRDILDLDTAAVARSSFVVPARFPDFGGR